MSRCFGTSSNLSAKEYTNKKRDISLFCNIRNTYLANDKKSTVTNSVCLQENNGKINRFLNQSTQLNIKKGYEYFSQKHRTDLSTNRIGQIIKNNFCSPFDDTVVNTDVSNNFTFGSPYNTRSSGVSLGQTLVVDCSGIYINRYAEIKDNTPSYLSGGDLGGNDSGTTEKNFIKQNKIIYDYCAVKKSNNINMS